MIHRIVSSVAAAPGVEHAAAALITPVVSGFFSLAVDSHSGGGHTAQPVVGAFVTPDWFASYGIAIKGGRDLKATDTSGSPVVVVVNESFARTMFSHATAIGQVIDVTGGGGDIKLGQPRDTGEPRGVTHRRRRRARRW